MEIMYWNISMKTKGRIKRVVFDMPLMMDLNKELFYQQ